jgi:hypothetical protein
MSFAERALQQDQIKFLLKVNNKAKPRRTTKSLVLGKAKVMKWEDLEAARTKRVEKEKARATTGTGTGKRARKPKNIVLEGEGAAVGKVKCGRKHKSLEPDSAAGLLEPRKSRVVRISEEPAMALIARMREASGLAPVAKII